MPHAVTEHLDRNQSLPDGLAVLPQSRGELDILSGNSEEILHPKVLALFDRGVYARVLAVEIGAATQAMIGAYPFLVAKLLKVEGLPTLEKEKENIAFKTSFELLLRAEEELTQQKNPYMWGELMSIFESPIVPLASDFSEDERKVVNHYRSSAFISAVSEVLPFALAPEPADIVDASTRNSGTGTDLPIKGVVKNEYI